MSRIGAFPAGASPSWQDRPAGEAYFIQTYSFFDPQKSSRPRGAEALPEDVVAPVGTANAYDAMHLLALAIEQAGSTDADAVRMALEHLKQPYEGLMKTYATPFTPGNHDELGSEDNIMVHYVGDKVFQ